MFTQVGSIPMGKLIWRNWQKITKIVDFINVAKIANVFTQVLSIPIDELIRQNRQKIAKIANFTNTIAIFVIFVIADISGQKWDGKVWYLPHHSVYHPNKPNTIRVVFDCSAHFKGLSLNNLLYTKEKTWTTQSSEF